MSSLFLVGVTRTLMTLPLAEADVRIAGDMEDF